MKVALNLLSRFINCFSLIRYSAYALRPQCMGPYIHMMWLLKWLYTYTSIHTCKRSCSAVLISIFLLLFHLLLMLNYAYVWPITTATALAVTTIHRYGKTKKNGVCAYVAQPQQGWTTVSENCQQKQFLSLQTYACTFQLNLCCLLVVVTVDVDVVLTFLL